MKVTLEQSKKIVEEIKKRTAKECYKFDLSNENALLTDTKLSGLPYMPVGEEFPKDKNGNDMVLLAQINFKDIKLKNYPEKGIFQIFVQSEVSWPTETKTRYYEDISLPARADLEFKPMEEFVQKEFKLNVEKTVTSMPINDYRFDKLFQDVTEEIAGERIEFYDLAEEIYDDYNMYKALDTDFGLIGGYADFSVKDPRNNSTDKSYDECLIKVYSGLDMNNIIIGDEGHFWVLIKEEDLKICNFENVSYDWDCL